MLKPKWSIRSPLSITHSPTNDAVARLDVADFPADVYDLAGPFVPRRHWVRYRDDVLAAV